MSDDYVALIPKDPSQVPDAASVEKLVEHLVTIGACRRDGESLKTGPFLSRFIKDPRPHVVGGKSVLESGADDVFVETYPYFRGHAGTNFEPIACRRCNAELPFDEMLAALGAATGHDPVDRAQLTIGCIHCESKNYGPDHDYGISGGFSRFAIRFAVPTSRRTEPDAPTMVDIQKIVGCPMKLVQVLS